MKRTLLLTFCLLCLGVVTALAQASIQGKVIDDELNEGLIGANVVIYRNGEYIDGTSTDFDGNFSINNIDPGTYVVEVTYTGFASQRIEGYQVNAGRVNKLDIKMLEGEVLNEFEIVDYTVPLIEQDNTTTGGTVTADQIQNLPIKNVNALAATTAGLATTDEGDAINVKGARDNATEYFIDGVRVRADLIPQSEIEQLQVITGGVDAQYGDVTGGIISITTKGPSKQFRGGLELETSEFLDAFGYNLASANVSGPILKKMVMVDGVERERSILGYRFSGQYRRLLDDDAPAIPIFQVRDDVLADLQANPIIYEGAARYPAARDLGNESVQQLDFRPNEENSRLDLTAKIDARLSDDIDITFSGAFYNDENQFTPNYGSSSNSINRATWTLLNSQNNPTQFDQGWRGNFRFRHRLGGNNEVAEGAEGAGKGLSVRGAIYTIQFGYENENRQLFDPRHEDRFFDYGYIGRFDYSFDPIFVGGEHVDYFQNFQGYTPGDANPVLANYNIGANPEDINSFTTINGFTSDIYTAVNGFHTNVGTVYNLYNLNSNDTYNANISTSFELVPGGGSDKGVHNIELGFQYEQRDLSSYSLNPRRLWQIGQQQANRHIIGIDTANVLRIDTIGNDLSGFPITAEVYGTQVEEPEDLFFYRRVREITGDDIDEYVNIDALDPSQLRLDLYAPKELNDQNIVNYYGYDYLGNKLDEDVTFNDFFTATDENGIRTFPVGSFKPIYAAGYIQDKFTFKDVIFRLGVRADYFDANTKVLKDQYSLYDIQSAADFHANEGGERPGNVGEDFKVYTSDAEGGGVRAYRDGDQWYFADGTAANSGSEIFGGQVVFPAYTVDDPNIQSRDYDPNISFEDYEPQVNWMPRLAFSFPISEDANFYAHYDVLVQRPQTRNLFSPLDYFYFTQRSGIKNNPNLRPSRTVDYQVGFQQKLTSSSALKISAYYREMRDMVQAVFINNVPAPLNFYQTFGNLDFGTVKGFTLQYDLRRTGNVSVNASYTLQFADGTGSSATSSQNLGSRGVQRNLFPLSFDERHRLNLVIDYRYGSGKKYNGPEIGGNQIFANAGINIQSVAVSGRPYTAELQPEIFGGSTTVGSLNGARLPWNFVVNAQVDKNIELSGPDASRPLNLNVYFRVSNLLDRRNIIRAYSFTGSPTDDGYLNNARGLSQLDGLEGDRQAYIDQYNYRLLNPTFYSLPRRMFLGALFNF